MRCPLWYRRFVVVPVLLLAAAALAACSSGDSAEAGAVGTSSSDPLAVTFTQSAITIENRTGVPVTDVRLQITPRGVYPPFRATMPRIETSQKVDVSLSQFRSADGTPFRQGVIRTRNLRVTATDVTGKTYEQEMPFE
jgi:hypothetical protein